MRAATSYVLLAVMAALYGCAVQVDSESDVERTSEAVTSIPRFEHVVIAIMENEDESAIIGNSSAPYINSLAAQGASFTNMHGITHPSQPNYIGLFSGSTQGVTDDSCPKTFGTANLGKQLLDAGLTIKAYSEDLPSVGFTGCTSGKYARKHAPWTNFSNFPHTNELPFTSFPQGNFAALPTLSFVVPNLCNDMHDCSVATGDTWLKNNLDAYAQWAKTHNSLLILTWDEDDFTTVNQIATVFVGAQVQPGNYNENINHYNVLHTLESMYGLTQLGASAAPITDVWSAAAPSNDFSLALGPAQLTLAQGANGSSTLSTAITSGSAQTVSLSVSGLPAGVSGSFSPASISSGQSAALSLGASASAAAGVYNLTVTATGAQATHSASLSLTITQTGGGSSLVNGDFEAGSLTGWSSTGSATLSGTAHHGTAAAQLGGTNPTTDSTLSQTFTAPADATQLSFWYQVTCPDNVTYDWTTATLKDNASGTTQTVLAKTCTNDGTWRKVTAAITSGHSYTLTLANHDDNYAGDATYTRYDEITLSGTLPSTLTNAGFETGDLSGWTASGSASVGSDAHEGTHSATVGSTAATNGDSSLAQTFTAPTGSSGLSFWYKVHCPDNVSYDWATATLTDAATSMTTTVLAKTCTNNGSWVQANASIVAGHSYTLKLFSHDDNYAGDATYVSYDDLQLH